MLAAPQPFLLPPLRENYRLRPSRYPTASDVSSRKRSGTKLPRITVQGANQQPGCTSTPMSTCSCVVSSARRDQLHGGRPRPWAALGLAVLASFFGTLKAV